MGLVRMGDAVELFAQLPCHSRSLFDRDRRPEQDVEHFGFFPGAEDVPPPRLACFPASGGVHTRNLARNAVF
jgi:hypothetical protein